MVTARKKRCLLIAVFIFMNAQDAKQLFSLKKVIAVYSVLTDQKNVRLFNQEQNVVFNPAFIIKNINHLSAYNK